MKNHFATELASLELLRYPRTKHLEGSRPQGDDEKAFQSLAGLKDIWVVIEEKLDGANSAISISQAAELLLQSRGHYLMGGGRERQFSLLRQWASAHEAKLLERLEDRFVMYGEWCYAKHSVYYDALPHYFNEFDLWDRKEHCFLSTPRRHALLSGSPVLSVPVIYEGVMPTNPEILWSLVQPSLAKSSAWREGFEAAVERQGLDLELSWKQTDGDDRSEGLYIKVEDSQRVLGRFKLVRPNFTQTILDSGSHHSQRPLMPNALEPGVDLFSHTPTRTWEDRGLVTVKGIESLKAFRALQHPENNKRTRRSS